MAQSESILRQPEVCAEPQSYTGSALPNTDAPIPIWGGVECTLNRVGDSYLDQVEFSGHTLRLTDFEKIAELGIRTLRFGTLWERAQSSDMQWTDRCMATMRRLGIRPIAGLLHHGSGPLDTSLLDVEFPTKLAQHAGMVAERYPDIDAYTPVNEPNTTARFSGQYGFWYPHHRSRQSFLRALINQVRGVVLSMEAVRRIRSDAQLIQTDDCGSITGTEELKHVSELLHVRQWLTFDLLFGRVDRWHPMFNYLLANGISEHEILWFGDHPCAPNVVGLNYYATSDRFLDHRPWLYPASLASSEGPFVDVESVRVESCEGVNFARPLQEAWQRYGCPIALTEVHLGGPPLEQVRWLAAAWHGMEQARSAGVQCAALTVWALLGSYFWNELVTRNNGYYEPGLFDLSSGQPVPTELAGFVAELAKGHAPQHAALQQPGWWAMSDRTCYPWADVTGSQAA